MTYQLEHVTCGKPKCRRWHGPYWYAYWTSGGRTRSLYIGKTLRPAAEVAIERVQRAKQRRTESAGAPPTKRSRASAKEQLP